MVPAPTNDWTRMLTGATWFSDLDLKASEMKTPTVDGEAKSESPGENAGMNIPPLGLKHPVGVAGFRNHPQKMNMANSNYI